LCAGSIGDRADFRAGVIGVVQALVGFCVEIYGAGAGSARRADPDTGEQTPETWDFTKLGDARVLARYRLGTFESSDHRLGTAGVNFGVKLPTGQRDVRNADGELAERTLQRGRAHGRAARRLFLPAAAGEGSIVFAQGLLQEPLIRRTAIVRAARLARCRCAL